MSTVNVNTIKPVTDDVHLSLQAGGSTQMYVTTDGALSGTGGSITNFTGLGKVLQVVNANSSASGVSTTQTGYQATGHYVNVSPAALNSTFLVSVGGGSVHLSNAGAESSLYTIYVKVGSGTASQIAGCECYYSTNSTEPQQSLSFCGPALQALSSPSYTLSDTLRFEVYYKAGSSSTAYYNYNNTGAVLMVQEISG